VKLLARAIERRGSFDASGVKNFLENLDALEGAIKTYVKPFSEENHDALGAGDFFMAKFDKDGAIAPIEE
jgi:hypothetical protein